MATTSGDENEGRMHVGEAAREIVENMRIGITGKASQSFVTVVLLMGIGALAAMAPFPLGPIGAAAVVLLVWRSR